MIGCAGAACAQPAAPESFRARLPEDEFIYFVLPDRFENGDPSNDRGGIAGGRLEHGFDPAHKGFYHGGDLAGLTRRLDYIQGLGATAIWLGPIYRNKPVQGPPGQESAGYHGYWITDFLDVDPHLGTREELRRFVEAAHARGMKVYLDIITNHTADVIRYRDCATHDCPYRSHADYPYARRGGPDGAAINDGFAGVDQQTAENFARLTRPDFAWQPYVPAGEEHAKSPAWLNDPIFYHNRGNTTFQGESSRFGDFAGLDDLFTENPRVVQGMIDIFGQWIDDFGVDGFRIDTARHVNPEFWQAFVPAMLERARARGIPNFHIFGEVYDPDPGALATFIRVDRFPAVLDFAFQSAVSDVVARRAPTERLARLFQADILYEGGVATAGRLPTFLGNHDMGRFAHFVRQANPEASEDEVLKRVTLGHALLMFARGVPTLYYGDEQGFAGDGGDQDAREDMFASRVASYNDNRLVGSNATTAQANFDTDAPLYRAISRMAAIRAADPALRRGAQRVLNTSTEGPGLFAISRRAPDGGGETLIVFNTGTTPLAANLWVSAGLDRFEAVHGTCAPRVSAPGSYRVDIPPLDFVICRSLRPGDAR
ncbi:alpha-amylase family glycosyl hydrolase [Sphingosinicella sp. LHD-64]|nr:alpha-amylase family glycosyl hydrolase [Sphingosinicella sp. LHD-64]MDQ8756789.1 alpha-amylase family glycosyl hydrolase [Sphingosinicella sp. LHD-64]